jgi:hypothetical protein
MDELLYKRGAPEKFSYGYTVAWLVQYLRWKGWSYPDAVALLGSASGAPSERTIKRHYSNHRKSVERHFHEASITRTGLDAFIKVSSVAIEQELHVMAKQLSNEAENGVDQFKIMVRRLKRHMWLCVATGFILTKI